MNIKDDEENEETTKQEQQRYTNRHTDKSINERKYETVLSDKGKVELNQVISDMANIPINNCQHRNLTIIKGCKTCQDCGWSACGIL